MIIHFPARRNSWLKFGEFSWPHWLVHWYVWHQVAARRTLNVTMTTIARPKPAESQPTNTASMPNVPNAVTMRIAQANGTKATFATAVHASASTVIAIPRSGSIAPPGRNAAIDVAALSATQNP